jgi:Ran GTPase-activating protein (RanGAP) involved in mRNA processing and transport
VFSIWLPNTIELYDKYLGDEHCIELIDFLQYKELISCLNLRKNRIGNLGANRIAKFLTEQDSTLVDIDLNRNRIDADGATELVDAVHGTIRIENFAISYGNQIGSALAMAFEQEIKANT